MALTTPTSNPFQTALGGPTSLAETVKGPVEGFMLATGQSQPAPAPQPARTQAFPGQRVSQQYRDQMPVWKQGIAGIESAGQSDPYQAVGPVIPKTGDRAIGKYQVMSNNVPSWTKEAIGVSLTPEQFRNSKWAQEKVFEYKFGSYVNKYGNPQDAAHAWFTGGPRDGRSVDDGYTSNDEYVSRFNQGIGAGGGGMAGATSGGSFRDEAQTLVDKLYGIEREARGKSAAEIVANSRQEQRGSGDAGVEVAQADLEIAQPRPDDAQDFLEMTSLRTKAARQRAMEDRFKRRQREAERRSQPRNQIPGRS